VTGEDINEEAWSSEGIPAARRFRGFQDMLDRTHSHWALESDCASMFNARVWRRPVDEFVLTQVEADSVTGTRKAADIRRETHGYFCLLYLSGGDVLLRQGANESVLGRASIAIWDSARPAKFISNGTIKQFAMLIPHRVATTIVPGIEERAGLAIDGHTGLGRILLSHLARMHRTIGTVEPAERTAVLRATVELLAATFKPAGKAGGSSAFRRAALARAQDFILANLDDPHLSPRTVAAACQFSARYLHRLFEDADVTVGDWIRTRRLHAIRADLENPACAGNTITQIALRRGFCGSSHLSNCFKQEFGMSPRDYRREALRDKPAQYGDYRPLRTAH